MTNAEGLTVTSASYSEPVCAEASFDFSQSCDEGGHYISDGLIAEDMPSWPRGEHNHTSLSLYIYT